MGSPADRYIHLAEEDGPGVEAIRTATKQWDASDMFGGHFQTAEDKVIMLANFIDVPLRELKAQLADLKEQAAIMDSVHKEMMAKLGIYKEALVMIVDSQYYGAESWARDALEEAAGITTLNKGVKK